MGRSDEANRCAARTTEMQVSKWTTARTLWWLSVGLKSRHARRWSVSQSSPQTDPDSCPSRPWLPPSEPVNQRQQVATVTGSKWPHRYGKGMVELCNLLHRNVLIHLCLYHSLQQVINMSRHSQTSPLQVEWIPLLTATSAFGLERRCWSSPQHCYLHYLRTFTI